MYTYAGVPSPVNSIVVILGIVYLLINILMQVYHLLINDLIY